MRRAVAGFLAAVVVLSACGSDDAADTATSGQVVATTAAPGAPSTTANAGSGGAPSTNGTARSVVPAVDVTDVATGESTALRSRVSTTKPTLLWMWAPH